MDYFDLHCDTLTELYLNRYRYSDAPLHISGKYRNLFHSRIQAAAVWTDSRLSDEEGFARFGEVLDYAKSDPDCGNKFEFITDSAFLEGDSEKVKLILTVEDGRVVCGKEERIEYLYDCGVRVITPVWGGMSCIGGAHDTDAGATDFGLIFIRRCIELGITLDVSHASVKLADEIISAGEAAGVPVIATHSNSRAVYGHSRNLSDDQFRRIRDLGGVVGISLAPQHLTPDKGANSEDVMRHMEHYLSMDGENTVCLGCDFDGIEAVPADVRCEGDIPHLYDVMKSHGFGSVSDRIVYENALSFFKKHL
jgi:membrane dipeptidase